MIDVLDVGNHFAIFFFFIHTNLLNRIKRKKEKKFIDRSFLRTSTSFSNVKILKCSQTFNIFLVSSSNISSWETVFASGNLTKKKIFFVIIEYFHR